MPTKAKLSLLLTLSTLFLLIGGLVYASSSDSICTGLTECDNKISDLRSKLSKLSTSIGDVKNKITALSTQLNVTQQQLDDVQNNINDLEKQLAVINKALAESQASLQDKTTFRNGIIRDYAKRERASDIELFFTSQDTADLNLTGFQLTTLNYIFNKTVSVQTINIIEVLNTEISNYEKDKSDALEAKTKLEASQNSLVALKNQIATQKNSNQNQLKNLQVQQNTLQQNLDSLSASQQALLNEKYGTGSSSVGDYTQPSSKLPNPPFSPAFAAMSYGAYTHYNGMSQYGAQARAKAGQDYKKILNFYYPNSKLEEDYDEPDKIWVKGSGAACNGSSKNYDETLDFSTYMKRIYEMPASWNKEALKAQAIAARTYAIRVSKGKGYIEPNTSNQVYKNCDNGSGWVNAVKDTEGTVLLSGGNLASTEYSSTTGGYINNVGWDVKSGGDWPGDAYEKLAGTPWFYKAWYTKSYNDSNTCGRSTPWLKESEMTDILNAVIVFQEGGDSDRKHIWPINCRGGNPYTTKEMASKAEKLGKKFSSISGVSKPTINNGRTTEITFQTDKGSFPVDGDTFITVFNLRAPGYVALKSRLYDMIRTL